MPDILARSGFRLLTKFRRQIINVVGKNENHNVFLHLRRIQKLNLRIGVFSQYTFKDWPHKLLPTSVIC